MLNYAAKVAFSLCPMYSAVVFSINHSFVDFVFAGVACGKVNFVSIFSE